MTDSTQNDQKDKGSAGGEPFSPFSVQPTTLVETSFAGSLGLSMHNEVNNQQSARLASLASTTNACKLILAAKLSGVKAEKPKKEEGAESASEAAPETANAKEAEKTGKTSLTQRLNLGNFLGRKKTDDAPAADSKASTASADTSPAAKDTDSQTGSDPGIKPSGVGGSDEPTESR